MTAVALLNLNTDFGRDIASRFPEYFSSRKYSGPIPLSIIQSLADKDAIEQGTVCCPTECLVSFDKYWREFSVPILTFSTAANNDANNSMLPREIASQIEALGRRATVGDVFCWGKKRLIVLENNDETNGWCFLLYFAPAECIAVDK